MKITKTLTLALAATIVLAVHSVPSVAAPLEYAYTQQDVDASSGGGDGESLWDFLCSFLF